MTIDRNPVNVIGWVMQYLNYEVTDVQLVPHIRDGLNLKRNWDKESITPHVFGVPLDRGKRQETGNT